MAGKTMFQVVSIHIVCIIPPQHSTACPTVNHPSFQSSQCQTQSSFNVSMLTGVEPSQATVTHTLLSHSQI